VELYEIPFAAREKKSPMRTDNDNFFAKQTPREQAAASQADVTQAAFPLCPV